MAVMRLRQAYTLSSCAWGARPPTQQLPATYHGIRTFKEFHAAAASKGCGSGAGRLHTTIQRSRFHPALEL